MYALEIQMLAFNLPEFSPVCFSGLLSAESGNGVKKSTVAGISYSSGRENGTKQNV